MLGFGRNKCNLQYKFPKDNVNNKYLISVLLIMLKILITVF